MKKLLFIILLSGNIYAQELLLRDKSSIKALYSDCSIKEEDANLVWLKKENFSGQFQFNENGCIRYDVFDIRNKTKEYLVEYNVKPTNTCMTNGECYSYIVETEKWVVLLYEGKNLDMSIKTVMTRKEYAYLIAKGELKTK